MRKEITRLIHDRNRHFAIRNSHVNMQPENKIRTRDLLHVFDDGGVAFVHRDQLVHPMREWMRARRRDLQAVARRNRRQVAAKLNDLLSRASCVTTDLGAQLNHRLVHLGFDAFFQKYFAVCQNLLNVRAQLTRLRIDDLKLLLDAKSEDVFHLQRLACPRYLAIKLLAEGWPLVEKKQSIFRKPEPSWPDLLPARPHRFVRADARANPPRVDAAPLEGHRPATRAFRRRRQTNYPDLAVRDQRPGVARVRRFRKRGKAVRSAAVRACKEVFRPKSPPKELNARLRCEPFQIQRADECPGFRRAGSLQAELRV